MTPPKILFCITKSNWGGAQAYVYILASRLVREGHDVAVALGGTGLPGAAAGQLAERLAAAGVRVIHLKTMARDLSLVREFRTLSELSSVLKAERPDIFHLNSSKAGILGSLAGRLTGTRRIIFTAHGWPHREPRPLIMRTLIWLASWATVFLADRVIAVSACDRKTAPVFLSRRKICMIRNGITSFSLMERSAARAALAAQLPVDAFWFLMNAELHPNKGIDIALRAFSQISSSHPAARLVVAGAGQEGKRLKELVRAHELSDKVVFCGFVPDARSYLSAADCYLMPSRKEGLPMALLEAGMASLPVIASDTGGIPEVIADGETGWLIPTGNVSALAAAMREAITNPTLRTALGTALHRRIQSEFSEDRMYAETKTLYAG